MVIGLNKFREESDEKRKKCATGVCHEVSLFFLSLKNSCARRGEEKEGGDDTREREQFNFNNFWHDHREREREIFCWQHVQNWLDDKASLSYCWTKDVRISTPLTFQSHCGAAELVLSGGVKFKTLIKRENKKMAHFPTAVTVTVVSHLRVNAFPQE